MKTIKSLLIILILVVLAPINLSAQKMYRIHEDVVKPSHIMEYETVVNELLTMVRKHNIQNTNWLTSVTVNSHYLFISPLENMAELDKPNFISELVEKEGSEKIMALFNRMDKCYDTELDYIISLNEELTYMPEGISQTIEGENFREFHYVYVSPGNRAVMKEKMKAIKALYESKGSKTYYRVYNSGFGTDGEFYMVAIAAKDAEHMAQKGKANEALFGEDGQKTMWDMYSNVLKYKKMEAEMRPDLAYSPK
jgi:Fe-S cluster assembly scaffold protein SufB